MGGCGDGGRSWGAEARRLRVLDGRGVLTWLEGNGCVGGTVSSGKVQLYQSEKLAL